MYNPDEQDAQAVSAACRAVGEVLGRVGGTDLAKLSKEDFRAVVKAAICAWVHQRNTAPPF